MILSQTPLKLYELKLKKKKVNKLIEINSGQARHN